MQWTVKTANNTQKCSIANGKNYDQSRLHLTFESTLTLFLLYHPDLKSSGPSCAWSSGPPNYLTSPLGLGHQYPSCSTVNNTTSNSKNFFHPLPAMYFNSSIAKICIHLASLLEWVTIYRYHEDDIILSSRLDLVDIYLLSLLLLASQDIKLAVLAMIVQCFWHQAPGWWTPLLLLLIIESSVPLLNLLLFCLPS